MAARSWLVGAAVLALGAGLMALGRANSEARKGPDAGRTSAAPSGYADDRHGYKDSFKYYGPNGLWKTWTAPQREGRDTWIFWTGGNQKFLRLVTELAGRQALPLSVEYFRMLDSRNRYERFRKFGLINEPNCEQAAAPERETGLWLDEWKGDPLNYYPDSKVYGEPTGIVGLRKFRNPRFWGDTDEAKKNRQRWNVAEYFKAPSRFEPPYHVGFSCAFCHMGFDPNNPPRDPERPRWENLAANIGNQYFREGDLFLGRGRVILGDRNPGPRYAEDPYDTEGLNARSFLFHYAITQQPGTSETSRISYDFINNPNTINSIFYLGSRPLFPERSPDGKLRVVNHILKDGADSVGVDMALLRVWINIGCEGRYWIDSLFNPVTGVRQKPLNLDELHLRVSKERLEEMKKQYGPDVGQDWAEAHRRNPNLIAYLASYPPYHLQDAPGGAEYLKDQEAARRGALLFAL